MPPAELPPAELPLAERVPVVVLTVARQPEALRQPRLKVAPSEQPGAILLHPEPVEQHRDAQFQPREWPGVGDGHDAAVSPVLAQVFLVPPLEMAGVVGEDDQVVRARICQLRVIFEAKLACRAAWTAYPRWRSLGASAKSRHLSR